MNFVFRHVSFAIWIFACTITCFVFESHAQMDPSSGLFLGTGSSGSGPSYMNSIDSRDSGLDSGRYRVRTSTKQEGVRESTRAKEKKSTNSVSSSVSASKPAKISAAAVAQEAGNSTAESGIGQNQAGPTTGTNTTSEAHQETRPLEPTVPPANRDSNRKTRHDLLEIDFAPMFLYMDSKSASWFRNYSVNSLGYHIDGSVWFSESVAIRGSYASSLGASIDDSVDGSSQKALTLQWIELGIRYRLGPGDSLAQDESRRTRLTLGLDYSEASVQPSSDSTMRMKLRSSGPEVSLNAEVPHSTGADWILGVRLAPKLSHIEEANKLNASSGTLGDSNRLGISFGYQFSYDDATTFFFKTTHFVQRSTYKGAAAVADPVSGKNTDGTSVTESTSWIEFGVNWGN